MRVEAIEERLREQLRKDEAHPSRVDGEVVNVSGTACGLAIAIGRITGEENEAIYARVMGQCRSCRDELVDWSSPADYVPAKDGVCGRCRLEGESPQELGRR